MYVKTDGPVPEGVPITAGKVYEVDRFDPPRFAYFKNDDDYSIGSCIGLPSAHMDDMAEFNFCDQHGNPVAAPWEVERMESAEEMAAIYPEPIDYRAHAERLAEVLYSVRKECGCGHPSCSMCRDAAEIDAALAAYNKDKGGVR